MFDVNVYSTQQQRTSTFKQLTLQVHTTMSTFSITSPRFTEEDNQRELASLTPQELQAIEEDVCGSGTDPLNESEDMKVEGVVQLDEAIDLIPLNEKQAYARALEVCPELVKKESDPVAFLRADNFNSWVSECH